MSTERSTHANDAPEQDSVESTPGAKYGRSETAPETEPADAGCCQNCGHDLRADPEIDAEVLRVVGDNHERTPVCDRKECRQEVFGAREQRRHGSTFSRAVQRARGEIRVIVQ